MTVKELIEFLQTIPPDTVVSKHDSAEGAVDINGVCHVQVLPIENIDQYGLVKSVPSAPRVLIL